MIVDLIDGTYELFRQFYGLRRFNKGADRPFGAVAGVLKSVLAVQGERVLQVDRRGNKIRTAADVRQKFGVPPELIPDYLALVGDAADGYPGVRGIGAVGAARLLNEHGPIERFPPAVLGEQLEQALLFKRLATLDARPELFRDIDELRWRGPRNNFAGWCERMGESELPQRCARLLERT